MTVCSICFAYVPTHLIEAHRRWHKRLAAVIIKDQP